MFFKVLIFVRLPIHLLFSFKIARFRPEVAEVPYAPRVNAMFSIVGLMFVSRFCYGAFSTRLGKFTSGGEFCSGVVTCFTAESLVLLATRISYFVQFEHLIRLLGRVLGRFALVLRSWEEWQFGQICLCFLKVSRLKKAAPNICVGFFLSGPTLFHHPRHF